MKRALVHARNKPFDDLVREQFQMLETRYFFDLRFNLHKPKDKPQSLLIINYQLLIIWLGVAAVEMEQSIKSVRRGQAFRYNLAFMLRQGFSLQSLTQPNYSS
jgi:hypothetical protein